MNIKNKSDLAHFPDGGRATKMRRFQPTLTRLEFNILRGCPYESPGHPDNRMTARRLMRAGLLEEDPSAPGWFRVTSEGADIVQRWKFAGWGDR